MRLREGGAEPKAQEGSEYGSSGDRAAMRQLRLYALRTLLVTLCMAATPVAFARAQVTPSTSLTEQEQLERDFTDPPSTVPPIIIRDGYTPATYALYPLRWTLRILAA